MARESGHLLLWDDHHWLTILNHAGERQSQHHRRHAIIHAAISENASAIVMADADQHVALYGLDFKPLWERRLSQKLHTVAIDALGELIAVAEVTGRIRIIDRLGQLVRDCQVPRPAHHLAFEPSTTRLVVAADFGFVGAIDLLNGEWCWRDTPVVHLGSLAVTGAGDLVLVACFNDGARIYDPQGHIMPIEQAIPACKIATMAYDGRMIVTAGLRNELRGYSPTGRRRFEHVADHPWVSVSLSALGDRLVAASAEPCIFAWNV